MATLAAAAGTWLAIPPQPAPATFRGHNGPIVFVSDRTGSYDIYTAAPNGKSVHRLTNDPEIQLDPVWSANRTSCRLPSTPPA